MSENRDILETINEAGGFEQFLTSRKQLVDSLLANQDTVALAKLLEEDAANLAELQVILKKTGEHISNIGKIEQYNI